MNVDAAIDELLSAACSADIGRARAILAAAPALAVADIAVAALLGRDEIVAGMLEHDPSLATQAVFYGLSTATAFARTNDNKHWVSDVVAGALLGIYTADFVQHQHEQHRGGIAYAPYIGTDTIGIQASW